MWLVIDAYLVKFAMLLVLSEKSYVIVPHLLRRLMIMIIAFIYDFSNLNYPEQQTWRVLFWSNFVPTLEIESSRPGHLIGPSF